MTNTRHSQFTSASDLLISPLTAIRMQKLPPAFYTRTDVVQIAKELLGKFLVTDFDGQITAGKIVETEAYRAPEDKASHAWNNRRTRRTEVMFREGGVAYVYLCYGVHHLFNVVTGMEGMAHAVLVRAVEPADNVALMLQRRNMTKPRRQLTAGPGVLTKALGILTEHSGLSLTVPDSPIWIEDRGVEMPSAEILAGPRVGVDYAGECAQWEWRFRVKDSPWTS
ncbi:MAG: DNA-3-methyladenine glycosylase [Saprospiraceae bacterium]